MRRVGAGVDRNEAIAIGRELNRLQFDGAWNLMRHYIDPVGKRLLSAPRDWEVLSTECLQPAFEIWHGGKRTTRVLEQAV